MRAPPKEDVRSLGAVLVLAAVSRLILFNGIHGHDDWTYLFYTRSFFNGITEEILRSPWGLRFGVWMPVFLSLKVFGVGIVQAFLPPFLFGLAAVALGYACAKAVGASVRQATLAAFLVAINPADWMTATTIRGDIEVSFYSGAVLWMLLLARRSESRAISLSTMAGVFWGLGILTKEWCYLFAWGILTLFVADWIRLRKIPLRYFWVGVGLAAVLFVDSLVVWHHGGVPGARIVVCAEHFFRVAAKGELKDDLSTRLAYLPSVLFGVRNRYWELGRFVNGYPDMAFFFWPLVPAVAVAFWRRSAAAVFAFWILATLSWMEFGSLSWKAYYAFHKEPRYLTVISVPAACVLAEFLVWAWGLRRGLSGAALAAKNAALVTGFLLLVVTTARSLWGEHGLYRAGREYIPALVTWLEANPSVRLWVPATIQNELDLRFAYAFTDPVQRHAGDGRHGSIMDIAFWSRRQPGDHVLVVSRGDAGRVVEAERAAGWLRSVEEFGTGDSHTRLYRFEGPHAGPFEKIQ